MPAPFTMTTVDLFDTTLARLRSAVDGTKRNRRQTLSLATHIERALAVVPQHGGAENRGSRIAIQLERLERSLVSLVITLEDLATQPPLKAIIWHNQVSSSIALVYSRLTDLVDGNGLGGKANLRTILKESKVVKELENEEFEQDCEGAMRDGNAVIEFLGINHGLMREAMLSIRKRLANPAAPQEHVLLSHALRTMESSAGSLTHLQSSFTISTLDLIVYKDDLLRSDDTIQVFGADWLGTRVAVSELSQSVARAVFDTDTSVIRHIRHPNLLELYGVCPDAGRPLLIHARHRSIGRHLRKYPDTNRLRILRDAALGLAHLHQHGVIHGAISATSILVSDTGVACLADYGLQRTRDRNGTMSSRELDIRHFGLAMCEILYGCFTSPSGMLERPTGDTDDQVWSLIVDCTYIKPGNRPDATTLSVRISRLSSPRSRISLALSLSSESSDGQANAAPRPPLPSLSVGLRPLAPIKSTPPMISKGNSSTDLVVNTSGSSTPKQRTSPDTKRGLERANDKRAPSGVQRLSLTLKPLPLTPSQLKTKAKISPVNSSTATPTNSRRSSVTAVSHPLLNTSGTPIRIAGPPAPPVIFTDSTSSEAPTDRPSLASSNESHTPLSSASAASAAPRSPRLLPPIPLTPNTVSPARRGRPDDLTHLRVPTFTRGGAAGRPRSPSEPPPMLGAAPWAQPPATSSSPSSPSKGNGVTHAPLRHHRRGLSIPIEGPTPACTYYKQRASPRKHPAASLDVPAPPLRHSFSAEQPTPGQDSFHDSPSAPHERKKWLARLRPSRSADKLAHSRLEVRDNDLVTELRNEEHAAIEFDDRFLPHLEMKPYHEYMKDKSADFVVIPPYESIRDSAVAGRKHILVVDTAWEDGQACICCRWLGNIVPCWPHGDEPCRVNVILLDRLLQLTVQHTTSLDVALNGFRPDVVIIQYDVHRPATFNRIRAEWDSRYPRVPLIVAGLATEASGIFAPEFGRSVVSHERGGELARTLGAWAFLEYANDARHGPHRVLQAASWLALQTPSIEVHETDGSDVENPALRSVRKSPKVRLSSSRRRLASTRA